MQRPARRPQLLLAGGEVDRVVGLAPIRSAAAGTHEAAIAKPSQVVGDEIRRRVEPFGQLPDRAIASDQFSKQAPAQRVRDQLDEPRRVLEVRGDKSRVQALDALAWSGRSCWDAGCVAHVAHQLLAA
jgi:hypothetical protein